MEAPGTEVKVRLMAVSVSPPDLHDRLLTLPSSLSVPKLYEVQWNGKLGPQ